MTDEAASFGINMTASSEEMATLGAGMVDNCRSIILLLCETMMLRERFNDLSKTKNFIIRLNVGIRFRSTCDCESRVVKAYPCFNTGA